MNYADNCYPFRQDSTFLYFFGLDQPGLAAVIDLDEGSTIVFGDELTIDDIVWMGDLPTIDERARGVGVSDTRPQAELASVVGAAVAAGRPVNYLPPYRADNTLTLAALLGVHASEVAQGASLEFIRAVAAQRNIKSDEEVAEIERAVDHLGGDARHRHEDGAARDARGRHRRRGRAHCQCSRGWICPSR